MSKITKRYMGKLVNKIDTHWERLKDRYYYSTAFEENIDVSLLLTPPLDNEISMLQARVAACYSAIELYNIDPVAKPNFYNKLSSNEESHSEETFKKLIESFEASPETFDKIVIDLDNNIIDGYHRFSLFLYKGYKKIHVKRAQEHHRFHIKNWWNFFVTEKNFTTEEVKELLDKYKEIYNKVNNN